MPRMGPLHLDRVNHERLAKILAQETPEGESLVTAAVRRWDDLKDTDIAKIVGRAKELRNGTKEDEVATKEQKEFAEKYRAATEEVLMTAPGLHRDEMYQKVKAKVGGPLKQSSWEVTYYYPIRKELEALEAPALPNNTKSVAEVDAENGSPPDPSPEDLEERKGILNPVGPDELEEDLQEDGPDPIRPAKLRLDNGEGERILIARSCGGLSATELLAGWEVTLVLTELVEEELNELLELPMVRSRLLEF